MLRDYAQHLVDGIPLVPFVGLGAPFGPSWPGHPFASPAMGTSYSLREADITRSLAHFMGPAAGRLGPQRARSFLRALADGSGLASLAETLTDTIVPSGTAEHPVSVGRTKPQGRRAGKDQGSALRRGSAPRIDLLFEWPIGPAGRQAVVVIEAKLGASVADGQLSPYRAEALRRAKGGPVHLFLLTAQPDRSERRYRTWMPVRWLALLRAWERHLAETGDADPEFARVRAHVWRFLLTKGRPHL